MLFLDLQDIVNLSQIDELGHINEVIGSLSMDQIQTITRTKTNEELLDFIRKDQISQWRKHFALFFRVGETQVNCVNNTL